MTSMRRASVLAICLMLTASVASAQSSGDSLAEGFIDPPDSAKTPHLAALDKRQLAEAGITKDLEWMKRSGIGGFQLVDVSAGGGLASGGEGFDLPLDQTCEVNFCR